MIHRTRAHGGDGPRSTTAGGGAGGTKKSTNAHEPRQKRLQVSADRAYYDISPADDEREDTHSVGGDCDYNSSLSDTGSNYSSVSEDSLPAIQAYGHTYHGSGRILTPNDSSERSRQDIQHALFKVCLSDELVDSRLPLERHTPENPLRILDVGTGNGTWACEMGERYPQVEILGIDVSSALLPKNVPSNVTFEVADAADPWPPALYDFIHIRNILGGGIRDWTAFFTSAYDHLKPGGRIEFTELRPEFFEDEQPDMPGQPEDQRQKIGNACLELRSNFIEFSNRIGVDFDPISRICDWWCELGFRTIRERVDYLPTRSLSTDPIQKRKNELLVEVIKRLDNWSLRLFAMCGWEEKDTVALLDRVLEEMQDPALRSCVKASFITARKPFDQRPSSDSDNASL